MPASAALLHFHEGKLRLALENQGAEPLTNLRITYRLPLAWNEGIVRRKVADLAAKSRREEAITPTVAHADYKCNAGTAFFLAQLDFRQGGAPRRLHTVCLCKQTAVDPSYPQGGFLKIGPFAVKLVDIAKLGKDVQAGKVQTQPWLLADNSRLAWMAHDPRDNNTDVEFVPMLAAWHDPEAWLLQTDIVSEKDQNVEFLMATDRALAAYLNNESVKGRREIHLRQGANRLWMVFPGCDAVFARVNRPGTAQRATDIRFAPPPIAAAAGAPYRPAPRSREIGNRAASHTRVAGAMATLAWPCGHFPGKHAHDERGHGTRNATLIRECATGLTAPAAVSPRRSSARKRDDKGRLPVPTPAS